ncbi:MAG: SUMF1/EgtB/PvdO family nonheme iron enzyme [Candidatus Latescibacter sp.]|nr:SUMF1/EgtB/PvdO family nonheme iron enzyme [Candidatus Latescibacter sp.]
MLPFIERLFLFISVCFLSFFTIQTGDPANFDRAPGYSYPVDKTPYEPKPHKPRQYVVYRTVDPISVDGLLHEKSWANAEWTNKFDHILSVRGYAKPFLATRAKMLWDSDRLYIAAVMEEPNLVGHAIPPRDTVVCIDNDFEIFIDTDGDAQNYIELQFNVLGSVQNIFFQKEYHRGGIPMGWPQHLYDRPYSPPWELEGLRAAVHVEGSINYPLDTDRGWALEVSIPWKSLSAASPNAEMVDREGSCLRIGFSRVEYLWPGDVWPVADWEKKGPCWDWTWTPNLAYDMHVPECWGRVILSGRTVMDYKDEHLENAFPFIRPPPQPKKPDMGSMEKIKGGTYTIGPDGTDPLDSPAGTVTVPDFYLDRYEVTIVEFARFLNAGGNDSHYMEDMADPDFCGIVKRGAGDYAVAPGKEYYPIVYARPESALAYASWAGKRLPTEYEWEIAARGKDARLYPWGDQPPAPELANFDHHVGHTTPVGSYEKGKTPEGVYDMAGNVWELLQGNWKEYPWGRKIAGMPEGRQLMRGGAWVTPPENIGSTYRSAMKYSGWAAMIGFRCAKDAR